MQSSCIAALRTCCMLSPVHCRSHCSSHLCCAVQRIRSTSLWLATRCSASLRLLFITARVSSAVADEQQQTVVFCVRACCVMLSSSLRGRFTSSVVLALSLQHSRLCTSAATNHCYNQLLLYFAEQLACAALQAPKTNDNTQSENCLRLDAF
jgi:hypothetical protein